MNAMDIFGECLYDYHKGDRNAFMEMIMENQEKHSDKASWYFRKYENFDSIERALFENISGKSLLDIGCASGYYFPEITKKVKEFHGIDISPKAIEIAKENGFHNTEVADIMNYNTSKKYDCITLIGNNLSIGGSIDGTHKLINILKGLLNDNGKILCIFRKIKEKYYISKMKIGYKDKISDEFSWIRIRLDYLEELLNEHKLNVKILQENDYGYCLEIRHF